MTLYSREVREYIHSRDWPVGLTLEVEEIPVIVEETVLDSYLQLIFFRDNFNQFEPGEQMRIAQTMNEVMMKLRADGVHCYLEVRARANGL